MSVTLTPLSPSYSVSAADDPFKKYWWAILMGIVFTALWLMTPMLGEKSVGSTAVSTSTPKADDNVEQSLDADAGDGINLSMEGTGRKRKEDPLFGSSLYEAPPEEKTAAAAATAGTAALGSASGSTLADALKKVGEGNGGWGEQKAQRGFNKPGLGGSSMSGMGAASGGRAGSASGGSSAFGSSNANIGFAKTSGLSGGGADDAAAPNSKGVSALKAASAQALLAAASKSNDDARSSMSKAFDGARGGNKIGGGGASLAGGYAALDAAPANLKLADPKMNEKKMEAPPATGADVGQSAMDDSQLAKQIAMQVAGAALGTVIGGPVGGIVTSAIMQAIQRQMDQQDKIREMEEKQNMDRAARRIGAKTSSDK